MTTLYSPGTMVRARDRDWIVLPESTEDVVRVRPADGRPEESTELLVALEPRVVASLSREAASLLDACGCAPEGVDVSRLPTPRAEAADASRAVCKRRRGGDGKERGSEAFIWISLACGLDSVQAASAAGLHHASNCS